MSDFDYGGDIAETSGGFKQPDPGDRNCRLYGLIRIGTFRETFKKELKDPAPQAIAIFHLLGKEDKLEDGSPMFTTKPFPLKKGSKSFLHNTFIPAMGGMARHKGFGTMTNQLCGISLVGSKETKDDGSPKYVNFGDISVLSDDTLEDLNEMPKYAPLDNPIGFLKENELTEEVLKMLHPTREFAGMVMQTEEFKAGTHPCQEIIQSVFDSDPERYTFKKSDKQESDDEEGEVQTETNKAGSLPVQQAENEQLDTEQEF